VPLVKATAQKDESNSYGDYYVPRGARILVVDDEPDIVEATTMLLELEGFECMSATSLETLETVLSKNSFVPDVLVSDFHLRRGETGLQIIDAARRQYGDGLPAILVSGDTTNRNMIQGRENISFLTKPVDVDQLISIASVLVTTKLAAA
jgi:DNA-binding NtrC family response regulator